jgi:glucokinase
VTTDTAIGIDIGGTKIAGGLVDRRGLVGDLRTTATDAAAGAEAVLERAIGLARGLLSHGSDPPTSAVGVATGGWVDQSTGRIVAATGLLPGWAGLTLREAFERALGLPAIALNDGHAMGIAEARLGAGLGRRVCLSVAVGTGIGGALTIDGRLFGGAHGFAGAIGHVVSRTGGPVCSCGRRGCIEAEASGPAIARAFAACVHRDTDQASSDRRGLEIGLRGVVDALASAEVPLRACAFRAIQTAGARLGRVLGGVANVVDPDSIVVGGGATAALGEPFLAAIRQAVAETLLPSLTVPVLPAGLGPSASAVGAGLVALDASAGGQWQLERPT